MELGISSQSLPIARAREAWGHDTGHPLHWQVANWVPGVPIAGSTGQLMCAPGYRSTPGLEGLSVLLVLATRSNEGAMGTNPQVITRFM